MRDPQGNLELEERTVVRTLHAPLDNGHYLRGPGSQQLVGKGMLLDFDFCGSSNIVAERLPFVSYPHEWSAMQLRDAARLTLDISTNLLPAGWELKDASAWNVLFKGCDPIFCDHLSFQRIDSRHWWAFGQYLQHFVFPLCVARFRDIPVSASFRLHRNGLDVRRFRALMGAGIFLTRFWPLALAGGKNDGAIRQQDLAGRAGYHANLYKLLDWFLAAPEKRPASSDWTGYAAANSHYPPAARQAKRAFIGQWLNRLNPAWVADLGCNTGEYSRLALESGARVIALDADHHCIDRLYQANKGQAGLHPLVADLDDLDAGRGWAGAEFSGLAPRLAAVTKLAMMLALAHHLAISLSIPYRKIAQFAADVTQKWLIVELIDENDPLVAKLCQQRKRHPSEFLLTLQRAAFLEKFRLLDELPLPGIGRQLLVLEKNPS
ncbi:hypothetical protein BI347_15445 [Chromobacterium sphagni]|uniref:SAM-dependent methyltransferase n=1 Tax=Chromobacterium sphagni TaxID=1903179 RepID=A0A1S1X5K8_9NEIS|nr:class I SAM-dependent methyltransferase [Chromobacterium sphagni]OHX14740.1 hypothetical protein BI347_15445 [Chromobacterium sphagni]